MNKSHCRENFTCSVSFTRSKCHLRGENQFHIEISAEDICFCVTLYNKILLILQNYCLFILPSFSEKVRFELKIDRRYCSGRKREKSSWIPQETFCKMWAVKPRTAPCISQDMFWYSTHIYIWCWQTSVQNNVYITYLYGAEHIQNVFLQFSRWPFLQPHKMCIGEGFT